MITVTQSFKNNQSASVRNCIGRVEFYNGSTLYGAFTQADRIQSIEIQRSGDEAKLLGFYVSQRVNVKLLDINRTLSISSGMKMKVFIGYGNEMVSFPTFKVTEVNRDETTNQLSITGYDLLYSAVNGKYGNLGLGSKVSIKNVGDAIAKYINSTKAAAEWRTFKTSLYGGSYSNPFEATEELSKVITQICEATASVAFLNNQDQLVFRGFSNAEATVETIGKSRYFSLKSKENKRIGTFYSIIGENQINYKSTGQSGTTVYIRDNGFFKLLSSSELDARLQSMIDYTGNYTMNQFEAETSGFLHLEFADRIALTLKDDSAAYGFIKSDTITFDGSIRHKIGFSFSNDQETATSPSTITEYLQRETNSRIDAIEKAAAEINGSKGGYISILDTNGDGNPDNIFITDVEITADDIVQYGNQYVLSEDTNATNVLRINKSGMGISTGFKAGTARNGYQTAVTGSGIVADTITSGELNTDLITFNGSGIDVSNVEGLIGKLTYLDDGGIYTGTLNVANLNVGWQGGNYAATNKYSGDTTYIKVTTGDSGCPKFVPKLTSGTDKKLTSAPFYLAKGAKILASCKVYVSTNYTIDRSYCGLQLMYCSTIDGTYTLKKTIYATQVKVNQNLSAEFETDAAGYWVVCPMFHYCGLASYIDDVYVTFSVTGDMVVNGVIRSDNGYSYFNLTNGNIVNGRNSLNYTMLADQAIFQYSDGNMISMIAPANVDSPTGKYYTTIGYLQDGADRIRIAAVPNAQSEENMKPICDFIYTDADGGYLTNTSNKFAGYYHTRNNVVGGKSYSDEIALGAGSATCSLNGASVTKTTMALQMKDKNKTSKPITARLDIMPSPFGVSVNKSIVALRGRSDVVVNGVNEEHYSKWLEMNEANLVWNGNNVSTPSSEKYKKDISKAEFDALDLINNSVIYKYRYNEEDENKPIKYGVILERECPKEIVDNSGDAINLYSMASFSWKAIQELSEKVEKLEARVKELEEKVGE